MSSTLLILFGIYALMVGSLYGEIQICGYNGDSTICCSGYKKDDQGECKIPICEYDCGPGGQCIRPYMCHCPNGRVMPSCPDESGQDSDGYVRRNNVEETCAENCNGKGECIRGKCECRRGHSGYSCQEKLVETCYLSLSRGLCQRTNNEMRVTLELCCSVFDVAWGDPCQKCPKSRCKQGFMEIDGTCQDVDECQIQGLCRNGRCKNLHGSYKCECKPGDLFEHRKGDCVKIEDECKKVPRVCGPNMKCVTLPMGKYICQCIQGFVKSKDQKTCTQHNTFNFCTVYGSYVCENGKCQPDGRNYRCECNPGYVLSGDFKSCKKSIDYCSLYQTSLCTNGQCVSVNDNYVCKCNPGYSQSFDRKKCTSMCDLYPTSLCPNAQCLPKFSGGYDCLCNEGYSAIGKGKECRRIMSDQSGSVSNVVSNNDNQASYYEDYCSHKHYWKRCEGGQCINKRGSYQCECLPGYVSDENGQACKKLDNAASGQMLDMAATTDLKSYCDRYGSYLCQNGNCVESGSSYQCRCNSGYKETSDGKICYDIDECAVNPNICSEGTCTNSPGSYQCSCKDGFTMHYVHERPKCYDRNECEEDKSLCSNGWCKNTWGSYTCTCNTDYAISNDGKQCIRLRSSSDSKDALARNNCRNCRGLCQQINDEYYECKCPPDLAPVLNTGLCAPVTEFVDIQFDIPVRRQRRSINNAKYIFFQLKPGISKTGFAGKIMSMYGNIVIDQCTPSSNRGRDGILCKYRSFSK